MTLTANDRDQDLRPGYAGALTWSRPTAWSTGDDRASALTTNPTLCDLCDPGLPGLELRDHHRRRRVPIANYDLTYVDGNLTVTKVVVEASPPTTRPRSTCRYGWPHLVSSDRPGQRCTTAPALSGPHQPDAPSTSVDPGLPRVSNYAITIDDAEVPANYDLTYVDGTLSCHQKGRSPITADALPGNTRGRPLHQGLRRREPVCFAVRLREASPTATAPATSSMRSAYATSRRCLRAASVATTSRPNGPDQRQLRDQLPRLRYASTITKAPLTITAADKTRELRRRQPGPHRHDPVGNERTATSITATSPPPRRRRTSPIDATTPIEPRRPSTRRLT